MNKEAARELIDYYFLQTSFSFSDLFAVLAILISVVSLGASIFLLRRQNTVLIEQKRHDAYAHLSSAWSDILDIYREHPKFLDLEFTENYFEHYEENINSVYEAFCNKIWGHINDIIIQEFYDEKQYNSIIEWVSAHHHTWLLRNPVSFDNDKFWNIVKKSIEEPHAIVRYKPLPKKDQEVDWAAVAPEFHSLILGPLAPEMVHEDANGNIRNKLLEKLRKDYGGEEHRNKLNVADFGCGPGNLIPHVFRIFEYLTGIDQDTVVLEMAKEKANKYDLKFTAIQANLKDLALNDQFDLIISINSILPRKREEVSQILQTIRMALKTDGKLYAILPSFDTVQYLHKLWLKHFLKHFSENHAERCVKSLQTVKKMDSDPEKLYYADDGRIVQCYHTPESIKSEFTTAGLKVTYQEKVFYPWLLTKKFDYGYFPKEEEIWDWFLVAERSDTKEDSDTGNSI
ncbi:MAG: class I SAM-dependent methyltransferase [Proteobacteria bacterium]|nr:class I SAM-dependent methyltransferase [Pseudomonadota bacterium]